MDYTQLICLANSWKHGQRCIAGLTPDTGTWIRPVCPDYIEDGKIPESTEVFYDNHKSTLLDVRPLDILELPLADHAPAELDFECENRTVLPGKWQVVGRAQVSDVIPWLQPQGPILHNCEPYVAAAHLHALPSHQRSTLQLVYTENLTVSRRRRRTGGYYWKAKFATRSGDGLDNATITDPRLVALLSRDIYPTRPCLVTVSLSMPYTRQTWTAPPDSCWKLIAGVLELSLADQILVEMHLAGWTLRQGQQYAMDTYGKMQRCQLTDMEKLNFIGYLKQLGQPRPQFSL